MSPLLFLIKRSLKNIIKGMARKPIVLIGYILVAAFLIFTIIAAVIMPSSLVRNGSPKLFTGIMGIIFTLLYFSTLKIGIDKGSSYFRMADVNLVFTSPVSPNNVLLYGFIKQVGGTFLLLFIALFQIPNLKNNFALKPYGIWMLLMAVAAYALTYPLISMLIYSWASRDKARKQTLKRCFNGSALLVAVLILYSLSQTRSISVTIEQIFNHPVARYFPIIGWTGSIASSAITGFTPEFWVGIIAMGTVIIATSILLYRLNLDYYEDVLEGTEYVEAAVKAKREGNMSFNVKVKKTRNKMSGSGAYAIFSKQLLEMRKTSYFFFFDIASVSIIAASIGFKFLMPEGQSTMSLFTILCFSVYMLLLFQMQGKLNGEMTRPYIFLIPASPSKKLFFTTLPEHVKNLIDGILLFILSGVIFKAKLPIILVCIFSYAAFGAVFVYTDVLCRRLFGFVHSRALLIYIKVFAVLLVLIPGIIAAVVAMIATGNELLMICAMGGWSLILAGTLFIFSSGILNDIESAG